MKHCGNARPSSHSRDTFHFDNCHLRLINELARGFTSLMTHGTDLIIGVPITAGFHVQTS